MNYIRRLGVLRALLAALVVALIAMAPFAQDHPARADWSVLPSLVAPAVLPIVLFVVVFDLVMGRAVMSGEERKQRYGTVLWTYAALMLAAALAWAPFFARLL